MWWGELQLHYRTSNAVYRKNIISKSKQPAKLSNTLRRVRFFLQREVKPRLTNSELTFTLIFSTTLCSDSGTIERTKTALKRTSKVSSNAVSHAPESEYVERYALA
jgi:hypothetical protein